MICRINRFIKLKNHIIQGDFLSGVTSKLRIEGRLGVLQMVDKLQILPTRLFAEIDLDFVLNFSLSPNSIIIVSGFYFISPKIIDMSLNFIPILLRGERKTIPSSFYLIIFFSNIFG